MENEEKMRGGSDVVSKWAGRDSNAGQQPVCAELPCCQQSPTYIHAADQMHLTALSALCGTSSNTLLTAAPSRAASPCAGPPSETPPPPQTEPVEPGSSTDESLQGAEM